MGSQRGISWSEMVGLLYMQNDDKNNVALYQNYLVWFKILAIIVNVVK